jgi:hypothetical protein
MGEPIRFSKATLLKLLDGRAARIAKEQRFNRGNGTSQLEPKGREFDEQIRRAVEYGRMRAMEEIARSVCEGFRFDQQDIEP